ncbi:MAG: hypothetical protein A4E63_01022 [Syntrophorhabdus sp. PtaU1.Bin050]|nr:MAG: hypothetical protein A4E63_01022 [Syntrophorhabdus sp. PtaU1.Bin050]
MCYISRQIVEIVEDYRLNAVSFPCKANCLKDNVGSNFLVVIAPEERILCDLASAIHKGFCRQFLVPLP